VDELGTTPLPPARSPDVGGHDIVVVGASAGGVEALRRLVSMLPSGFPAAMFVVLHLPVHARSALTDILKRAAGVRVVTANDDAWPRYGTVYVAPPDAHLLLKADGIHLVRGPTENGHRPAIDPLFRSAATAFGTRVIGVVLSGVLDDGTNGLLRIAEAGGLTVVQDPDDALYSAMPRNAIANVPVDVVAPVDEIAELLARLARHPRGFVDDPADDGEDPTEMVVVGKGTLSLDPAGRPSRFTCPSCGGALWEADDGGRLFRCRVGHSWTPMALLDEQADTLDSALWTALRALAERADLARRMRDHARARDHVHATRLFEAQLSELEHDATVIRHVLERPTAPAIDADDPATQAEVAQAEPDSEE
jgi:two-component system chemotaxis response regulator CheB